MHSTNSLSVRRWNINGAKRSWTLKEKMKRSIIAKGSYVYWTVHHLDSWIKGDQLDVTCFIISLFNAQHVSNVSTSILRSLRLIVDLFHGLYCSGSMCVGVTLWFGWGGVVSFFRLKQSFKISRKLLRIDVLTSETCWALNNEIIKQVTSSWSLFIQL